MKMKKRDQVLNGAIASVELERYKLSSYHREQYKKVLESKMSKEDYIRQFLKRPVRAK